MIPYNPQKRLISLHIPKTAGTSFRHVLETWFAENLYLHYPDWPGPIIPPAKEPGVCVHGHFNIDRGLGVNAVHPGATQFITVMRDPFDRMISLWQHLNRDAIAGARGLQGLNTFDAWFDLQRERAAVDPSGTGFLRNFPSPVTAETIPALFDDRFVAVGLTERMQDTVDLFARRLGRASVYIGRDNVSGMPSIEFARWRSVHEQAFPLEHQAYARAQQVFAMALED